MPTDPADTSISDLTDKLSKDQTDTLSSDQADVVIIRSFNSSAQIAINDDIVSSDSKDDSKNDSKDDSKDNSKDDDKRNSNEHYIDSVLSKFLSKRKVTPLQPLHTSPSSSSKQDTTLVEKKNSEATRSENEDDDQDYHSNLGEIYSSSIALNEPPSQEDYTVDINDNITVVSTSKQGTLLLNISPSQKDYAVDINDNNEVASLSKQDSIQLIKPLSLPTGPVDTSINDQGDVVIIRSVNSSAQIAINDDSKDDSKDNSKDDSKDNSKDNSKDDSKDNSKDDGKDDSKSDDKRNSNERYIDSVLSKFLSKRKVTPLQPLHTSLSSSSKQDTALVEKKNSEATRSENEDDDQAVTVDINDKMEVLSSSKQASVQLDKPLPPQSDHAVDINDKVEVASSSKQGSLIHSDNDDSDEDEDYQSKLNEFYTSGMI